MVTFGPDALHPGGTFTEGEIMKPSSPRLLRIAAICSLVATATHAVACQAPAPGGGDGGSAGDGGTGQAGSSTGATGTSSASGSGGSDGGSSSSGSSSGSGGAGSGGSHTGIVYTTCEELEPAFAAETLAIRSCTKDTECGQVLDGTSCGCTRAWVARLDADPTHFYELIEQGVSLECDLPLFSTCDCPFADGFVCTPQGICQWNYL